MKPVVIPLLSLFVLLSLLALNAAGQSSVPMIECRWDVKSAPFLITINNTLSKDVKIRQCPKKYVSGCTGATGQPDSYIDCKSGFPPGESYALLNVGVGYIVVRGNTSISMYPTIPGGGSWPSKINANF